MSLENTFYVVGIISMTISTVLLIAMVILLFYIKNRVTEFYNKVIDQFEAAKSVVTHPRETAVFLGASAAGKVLGWFIRVLRSRTKPAAN